MSPNYQQINVGDALPSLVKPPITEAQLVRYSGASLSLIHISEPTRPY